MATTAILRRRRALVHPHRKAYLRGRHRGHGNASDESLAACLSHTFSFSRYVESRSCTATRECIDAIWPFRWQNLDAKKKIATVRERKYFGDREAEARDRKKEKAHNL